MSSVLLLILCKLFTSFNFKIFNVYLLNEVSPSNPSPQNSGDSMEEEAKGIRETDRDREHQDNEAF